jgi:hypothetical protein
MASTWTADAAACCEDCFFRHNRLWLRDSSCCLSFRPRGWGRTKPGSVRFASRSRASTVTEGRTFTRIVVFAPAKL